MSASLVLIFATILVACIVDIAVARTLTSSDVANIQGVIATAFGLSPSYGTFCNAKTSPCPIGDNIGALVRLAFHDATGNGGANGCIDFTHTTSNNGLQDVVATLDQLYYGNAFDEVISKADLYVLAANTAISFATTEPRNRNNRNLLEAAPEFSVLATGTPTRFPVANPTRPPVAAPTPRPTNLPTAAPTKSPTVPPTARPTRQPTSQSSAIVNPQPNLDPLPFTLNLPFRYGRVDAVSCDDSGSLPDVNFKWNDIRNLFGGRFGMNIKEVVAIMGAHSLGRCEFANSGFDGGWTSSQSSFSNAYYKGFTASTWNNNNKSAVWTNGPRQNLLLMADVELLFDSATNGQGTCNSFDSYTPTTRCPLQAQSNAAFEAYANSNAYFFGNYSTAWQKMTEFGFSNVVTNVDSALAINADGSDAVYPQQVGTLAPTNAPVQSAQSTGSVGIGLGITFSASVMVLASGLFFYYRRTGQIVPQEQASKEQEMKAKAASPATAEPLVSSSDETIANNI